MDVGPYQAQGAANDHLRETLGRLHGEILALQAQISSVTAPLQKLYLSVDEVARLIGRAPYTIRRWIREGKLLARNVGGEGRRQRYLVHRDEITLTRHRI